MVTDPGIGSTRLMSGRRVRSRSTPAVGQLLSSSVTSRAAIPALDTQGDPITALQKPGISLVGVDVNNLNDQGQATAITKAPGGAIIFPDADAISAAVVIRLKMTDATVKASAVRYPGLTVDV